MEGVELVRTLSAREREARRRAEAEAQAALAETAAAEAELAAVTAIEVRGGVQADADALAEIAVAAWRPIRRRQAEALGPEQFARQHEGWEEAKASKVRETCQPGYEGAVLVATLPAAEGFIVGFVSFGPHEWQKPARERAPIGEIWNNAVHPDFQRKGIGTRLYAAALGEMAAAGMEMVVVGVGPENVPACRAYEKVGFRRLAPGDPFCRCELRRPGPEPKPEPEPEPVKRSTPVSLAAINKAGQPIRGSISAAMRYVSKDDLAAAIQATAAGPPASKPVLLDVRQGYEFEGGHVRGALHLDWRKHGAAGVLRALGRRRPAAGVPVVIYCEFGGKRSPDAYKAALKEMKAKGCPCFVLHGGYARFVRSFPQLCKPEGGYRGE
eukprot:COSAG04_NODE_225_length_19578_cov_17.172647_10_plen_383_part_00